MSYTYRNASHFIIYFLSVMNTKSTQGVLIAIIVVLAIVVVGLLATRHGEEGKELPQVGMMNRANQNANQGGRPAMPAGGNMMQAVVPADLTADQIAQLKAGAADHKPGDLTFNITGGSFYFAPNEIKVKQGDKVSIIFTNAGGMHNFILEAFNVKTNTLKTGENETVTFTADKKGTFEFYCGVGGGLHRMKGQIGVLIVE